MTDMRIELIDYPSEKDLRMVLRAVWVTMGKRGEPKKRISPELLDKLLRARHSPIRLLNFVYLIEDIPSNTSVHFCRHVHAQPFVSSLRNDRQTRMDGDAARRDTPVDMIYSVNAEELMIIANKRLCNKASLKTREAAGMMCDEAIKVLPELEPYLVPMCAYAGECKEIEPCGGR